MCTVWRRTTEFLSTPNRGKPEVPTSSVWMISLDNGKVAEPSALINEALKYRPDWHLARAILRVDLVP
jgi:hypothetical protein